jgi:hypothetical protein
MQKKIINDKTKCSPKLKNPKVLSVFTTTKKKKHLPRDYTEIMEKKCIIIHFISSTSLLFCCG